MQTEPLPLALRHRPRVAAPPWPQSILGDPSHDGAGAFGGAPTQPEEEEGDRRGRRERPEDRKVETGEAGGARGAGMPAAGRDE